MGKIMLFNNRLLKPLTSFFSEWRFILLLSLIILVLSLTLLGWFSPFQRAQVALSVSIDEESKVQIHIVDLPLGVIPIDLLPISFPIPGKHIVWMTVLVVPNLALNMVPWITYASILLWMRKKRMLLKSPTKPNPRSQILDLKCKGGEREDLSRVMLLIIPILIIGIVASFAIYAYSMTPSK